MRHHGGNVKRLSTAIRGYGYFAAICSMFMKESEINSLMQELLSSFSLVQVEEDLSFDGTLVHLPSVLHAFASLGYAFHELPELYFAQAEKLWTLLVMNYLEYPKWSRDEIVRSLIALLWMIHSRMKLSNLMERVCKQHYHHGPTP